MASEMETTTAEDVIDRVVDRELTALAEFTARAEAIAAELDVLYQPQPDVPAVTLKPETTASCRTGYDAGLTRSNTIRAQASKPPPKKRSIAKKYQKCLSALRELDASGQQDTTMTDFYTPKKTGRAKKKKTVFPPPAPKIKPVPRDLTSVEVLDLKAADDQIVNELSVTSPLVIDLTADTPGRVTEVPGDVLVEYDGIQLSMNSIFDTVM